LQNGLTGRVGLALGSGGARGWAHIGVIRALEEAGIRPEIVCGSSSGALVGALYAAGRLEALEGWGRQLDWRQVVSYLDLSFRGGLIRARRLVEFLTAELAGRSIESLTPSFAAVATDLSSGREIWLRQGPLVDSLRAAIALPGFITPVQVDGQWLVDGGLVNPVPISLCRALGADSVIAVDLNTTLLLRGEARAPEHPGARHGLRDVLGGLRSWRAPGRGGGSASPSLYEVVVSSINIMQVRIASARMAGDPPDLLITPRLADFAWLDFDRAAEAVDEGRRATARALAGLGAG
jgi:NTE family protein